MGQRWTAKTPDEVLTYQLNWSARLNGDTIATSAFTVEDGTVVLDSVSNGVDTITVEVSGGEDGETAVFLSRITTADGRTLDEIVTLVVRDLTGDDKPTLPSTATKLTILDMMFEEAALASYNFSRTAEMNFSALRKLDGLMAEWKVQGLDLGYNFPALFGQGDPDDVSGIPDWAINAVAIAAAFRVFPGMGKTASPETKAAYNTGMSAIRTACAVIPDRSLTRQTPRGSGNKPFSTWYPFQA